MLYLFYFFYFSQTANFGTNVIMETMVYKMFNKKENWDMVNYYIENSKLCFRDMKIMSRRNGGDSVNNESAGRVVYQNHHHS